MDSKSATGAENLTFSSGREFGPGPYQIGFSVAELKPHLIENGYTVHKRARGQIISVSANGTFATIRCECGAIVKEGV